MSKNEASSANNHKYQKCLDSYPTWKLEVTEGIEPEFELISPSGNIFTGMDRFADELESDIPELYEVTPYERDQYSADLGYSEMIFDCIMSIRNG